MNFHKKLNNKGFTLVELMIVIVIIGVLAALASFGFMQYVKKSKTAEADEFVKKITDGSKTYFTSEQKYGGDENTWHEAKTGDQAAGFPVAFGAKKFPGGATALVTHKAPPQGGTKQQPDFKADDKNLKPIVKKLQVSFGEPTYFQYSHTPKGVGGGASATVTAVADFDGVATSNHTLSRSISVSGGEAIAAPPILTNEFE